MINTFLFFCVYCLIVKYFLIRSLLSRNKIIRDFDTFNWICGGLKEASRIQLFTIHKLNYIYPQHCLSKYAMGKTEYPFTQTFIMEMFNVITIILLFDLLLDASLLSFIFFHSFILIVLSVLIFRSRFLLSPHKLFNSMIISN